MTSKHNKLIKGTATQSNYNLITESGYYWINPSVTTANQPVSGYGMLEVVEASSSARLQRFTGYQSVAVYSRTYANSQWYPWGNESNNRLIKQDFTNIASNVTINADSAISQTVFPKASF